MVQRVLPPSLSIPDLGTDGMRIAMLRETRMPAVLVEIGPAWVAVSGAPKIATAIGEALACWVSAPCDERRGSRTIIHTFMHRLWTVGYSRHA